MVNTQDAASTASTNIQNGYPRIREGQLEHCLVPIGSLRCSDSPRLGGENLDHIRALAEAEATFPPIIVDPDTMRVIDGMHRLRAALLRGDDNIEVRFFEGPKKDAFVLAVESNIKHGLPLSLADRTAAAGRILNSHSHWSDRAVAVSTGLSAKTVSAIRRCSSADDKQLSTRLGRDGRMRPLNAAEGRKIAAELMADKPDASLREIARAAGISLGTAQNVRQRLRNGEAPVTPEKQKDKQRSYQRTDVPRPRRNLESRVVTEHPFLIMQRLRKDPSLRFTDTGRALIRLLDALAIGTNEWERLICDLPLHCIPTIVDATYACGQVWQEFADCLERLYGERLTGGQAPGD